MKKNLKKTFAFLIVLSAAGLYFSNFRDEPEPLEELVYAEYTVEKEVQEIQEVRNITPISAMNIPRTDVITFDSAKLLSFIYDENVNVSDSFKEMLPGHMRLLHEDFSMTTSVLMRDISILSYDMQSIHNVVGSLDFHVSDEGYLLFDVVFLES